MSKSVKKWTAIDLFAGAGGFSQAATEAGVEVIAAVNHKPDVIAIHAKNHPDTKHGCYELNPDTAYDVLPDHDILIASPCCQGHSNARGADKAEHDKSRATLLAVTSTVHAKKPKVVIVENVTEVREWGEGKDGSRYRWWLEGFKLEGYHVSENVLDAADFGNGSRRERIFIVMVHKSVADGPVIVKNPKLPWVPARDVIDRTGKYDRKLTPIAKRKPRTVWKFARQWGKGMPENGEWIFCYRGKGYGYTLDEAICTITRVQQWCYVRGNKARFLQPEELARAMGFPAGYKLPKDVRSATAMIGNAVAVPCGRAVVATAKAVLDEWRATGRPVATGAAAGEAAAVVAA